MSNTQFKGKVKRRVTLKLGENETEIVCVDKNRKSAVFNAMLKQF